MREWRRVPYTDYMVSEDGLVQGVYGKVLKGQVVNDCNTVLIKHLHGRPGYRRVTVGQLIASAWTGVSIDEIYSISHLNGDSRDDRAANIGWRKDRGEPYVALEVIDVA